MHAAAAQQCFSRSATYSRVLRVFAAATLLALAIVAPGCRTPTASEARYRRGVVFVLPGIEGRSIWNRNIVRGLDDGGVSSAIEIYDWTSVIPGNLLVNLTDLQRNREQARLLAERIVEYHQHNPGRPVHLVGHSGGGGVAVLALEQLPPGESVDMAILLAPALSPEYDLTTALCRARYGICNFYSDYDVSFLKVGTSLFGPIDREHGVSAGAVGFRLPEDLSDWAQELYDARLRQMAWDEQLKRAGADGTHLGWASRRFAASYLAPLIKQHEAARPLPADFFERQGLPMPEGR
ncbi:alpha/beta fold hydrolase [uncultured Ilyobacter sp.]|uniref:alpha/beta fold hydrolase n=1 Tax=uncultured Ilyobacter sp. TaxID=544433 RepID=UPI0029F4875A|nr:alpha/beta fold hydrolase [uncultured Ilyobacter sp.]